MHAHIVKLFKLIKQHFIWPCNNQKTLQDILGEATQLKTKKFGTMSPYGRGVEKKESQFGNLKRNWWGMVSTFQNNLNHELLSDLILTSTKFVQKLRELNKVKHNYNYPKETNRAALRHTEPYGAIHNHTWSNRIILEHAGPYMNKCDHLWPYRTIQGYMGP